MAEKLFNEALLDKNLDDIDDLPGFMTPSNGVYLLKFSTSTKVVNDKHAVSADFEVLECVEQNNAEDPATPPGTKFNVLFFLENEFGIGKLKELLKPISEHFGVPSLSVLVTETCKDLEITAKVKQRKNKEDPDRPFADVQILGLA